MGFTGNADPRRNCRLATSSLNGRPLRGLLFLLKSNPLQRRDCGLAFARQQLLVTANRFKRRHGTLGCWTSPPERNGCAIADVPIVIILQSFEQGRYGNLQFLPGMVGSVVSQHLDGATPVRAPRAL